MTVLKNFSVIDDAVKIGILKTSTFALLLMALPSISMAQNNQNNTGQSRQASEADSTPIQQPSKIPGLPNTTSSGGTMENETIGRRGAGGINQNDDDSELIPNVGNQQSPGIAHPRGMLKDDRTKD